MWPQFRTPPRTLMIAYFRIFHYALLTQASVDVCVHAYVVFLILTVAKDTLKTFRYYQLFSAVSRFPWFYVPLFENVYNASLVQLQVCEVCFVAWVGFVWTPRSFMPRWPCTSAEGLVMVFGYNGAIVGVMKRLLLMKNRLSASRSGLLRRHNRGISTLCSSIPTSDSHG